MSASRSSFNLFRETYFDTADGGLRDNGMTLRLRVEAQGRQLIQLIARGKTVSLQGVVEETCLETPVVDGGLYATLSGASEVATRVREVVDPYALRPVVALDVDRESRDLREGIFRRPVVRVSFDQIIAHAPGATRAFHCITLTELVNGAAGLEALATRIRTGHGIESDGLDLCNRIRSALAGSAQTVLLEAATDARVAVLVLHDWEVALVDGPYGLTLPSAPGSGEEVARDRLQEMRYGRAGDVLDVDLLGFAPARAGGADLEVWLHEPAAPVERPRDALVWIPLLELLGRVGAPRLRDAGLASALLLLVRSEIGLRLLREAPLRRQPPRPLPLAPRPKDTGAGEDGEDFLDLDLSVLDFNVRVLELAEDAGLPLLERFKFLSIFSSNMDEFFVVRVASLKDELARARASSEEWLSPGRLLDLVAIRVRALLVRQYGCLKQMLLPALAAAGVHVRRWDDLAEPARAALSRHFAEEIFPLLTPLSLSPGPGRSFPRLVSLSLALVASLRHAEQGHSELGYVSVPRDVPRFLPVPGSADRIAVEDVIVANAGSLFPWAEVEDVHAFRASRTSDVEIDEDSTGSLLAAVADELEERPYKPVIRIEVQATMPRELRAYLLKELRTEQAGDGATLTRSDIYELDGPLDLQSFVDLCDAEVEDGLFPTFTPALPLAGERSIFDVLAERDVLVHHPFQDFETTVGRFLQEAASDPDVVGLKLTLYRTGRRSPVMDALLRACEAGKDVSVFVELKARFDEEHNIEWTHRLKAAGAHVIYGVLGYKTHAKTALVVRREGGRVRRYVHIGTGNYNATTSRVYTDLGLMSADADLGADLNDFFNALTGSAGPPDGRFRRLLVAPGSLGQELERMIEREAEHARAGRTARIQAKMNGLADRGIVKALYRASRVGVDIDLVVRSICTLRAGVPALSDRITVRSILGRFLEHGRIYYFENAGQSEYYIGSADWRARNLRSRVEVVTPVDDQGARSVLRAVLDAQLADPTAWVLRPDGVFERLTGEGPGSQERFMRTGGV
jgi:polyphosphate kinase